jgi:hypothetical protein
MMIADDSSETFSIAKAISIGLLVVNGPVLLLLLGPVLAIVLKPEWSELSVAYPIFWVMAWLWWSLSIPRWRLWAYKRVEHVQALKRAAVASGLTWPDGWIFEKTEIKTSAHAQLEKAYERRKP